MGIQRLSGIAIHLVFAFALASERQVYAEINQAEWAGYSAQEFAEAAASAFKSPEFPEADREILSRIAWSRFLADESFVVNGDLNAVQALVNLFAERRSAAVSESLTAEQVESQFAALKTTLTERLKGDRDALGRIEIYELDAVAKSMGMEGVGSIEKAELFIAWMEANDWRSLPLTDRYNLYGFVNADAVDRRRLSVRWTGFLSAPVGGKYVLRQVQQYSGTDSRLKVYLGDEIVLDSTDKSLGEDRFASKSVDLIANEAVAIRVEMTHEVTRIDWSEGAPMVVLTWEAERVPQEIIPSAAFAPPKDLEGAKSRGLKGEYFSDLEWKELKVTRLDRSLDLVSSWPPAAPIYHEQADAIFETCVADMHNDAVLAEAASQGNEAFFHFSMWRIAYRMSASDRVKLVEALIRTPEAVAIMTPEAMGRLMQAVYMLPGKEHLTLFGEWASMRPQPRCEAGEYPGWSGKSYQFKNLDFYWLAGIFWQRKYWADVETLWDDYLARENGECNLAVAYATAFAARENAKVDLLLAKIKERIDDKTVTPDQLTTWYIALAYVKGASTAPPEPMAGYDDLRGAMLVADSDDYSFWALQEIVARLSSVNMGSEAKKLIEENRSRFSSPEQQSTIARWTREADELGGVYEERKLETAAEAEQSYVRELQRRQAQASDRGDRASAEQLSEMIGALEAESGASVK